MIFGYMVKSPKAKMSNKAQHAAKLLKEIPAKDIALTAMHLRQGGYLDYVAARLLLLNGLEIQGLILASTCMEKYLKAVLATTGKKTKVHLDSEGFVEILQKNGCDVLAYISGSFLDYLGRAYPLRYVEIDSGPASTAIEQRKLLAELDYSVSKFESSLTAQVNGVIKKSHYALAVEAHDPKVWSDNHVLEGTSKSDFVEVHSPLFCMAIKPHHEVLETRSHFKSVNDSKFEFPKATYGGKKVEIDFGHPVDHSDFHPTNTNTAPPR